MHETHLSSKGFTLVELLVTLTIIVVVAGMVAPNLSQLILANAKASSVNTYLGSFAHARHQAVNNRIITAICPLDANGECTDNWNLEVAIFPDDNRDQKPDGGETWRVIKPANPRLRAHSRTAGTGSFHFGPDGILHGTTGSIVLCPDDTSSGQMTYIPVSRGGRARQVIDEDGDGLINLSWGGQVTCP